MPAETYLADFIAAYDCARRLETSRGLTPCELTRKAWDVQPQRFVSNPHHHPERPNS